VPPPADRPQYITFERVPGELVLEVPKRGEVRIPIETIQMLSIAPEAVKVDAYDGDWYRVSVLPVNGKAYDLDIIQRGYVSPILYVHWSEPPIIEQIVDGSLVGMTLAFEK
jgi:hypothetical protein